MNTKENILNTICLGDLKIFYLKNFKKFFLKKSKIIIF